MASLTENTTITPSSTDRPTHNPTGYGPSTLARAEVGSLDKSVKVPTLTRDSDFNYWKTMLKILLKMKGCLNFLTVDGTEIEKANFGGEHTVDFQYKRDATRGILYGTLDPTMLEIVDSFDDGENAYTIYQALLNHYEGISEESLHSLRAQLYALKMTSSMSLMTYLDQINRICSRLSLGGKPCSEDEKIRRSEEGSTSGVPARNSGTPAHTEYEHVCSLDGGAHRLSSRDLSSRCQCSHQSRNN